MKRFLIGLTISLTTFFCGLLFAGAFQHEQKTALDPVVETARVVEIPATKLEPPPPQIRETESAPQINEKQNENSFTGWYLMEDYKGMEEVNMILLSRDYELIDEKTFTFSKDLRSSAGVFTTFENYGDQGFVNSAWAEIDEHHAKFRTKKIKGIEYRFEGTFFKNKNLGKKGEKVLRGTLQKFVKGKKVAETTGEFEYREPQCWH